MSREVRGVESTGRNESKRIIFLESTLAEQKKELNQLNEQPKANAEKIVELKAVVKQLELYIAELKEKYS